MPISELCTVLKDERKMFRTIKTVLAILINEASDGKEALTESQIGHMITINNVEQTISAIYASFSEGYPETDEDADPNSLSE